MLAVGHYTRMMFAVARVGFEPTASLVLSQSGLPIAYRAVIEMSGAPGNRTPIFCLQNRRLPVGRAPHVFRV